MRYLSACLLLWGMALLSSCYYCNDVDCYTPTWNLKPPLGLEATGGDRSVTLSFDSANSDEDPSPFEGFGVYMAEGEYLANPVAQSFYDFDEINAFDSYGDGEVCNVEQCDTVNRLQPVQFIGGGIEAVETALGVSLPGRVTWTISNADAIDCTPQSENDSSCAENDDVDETNHDDNCIWGEGDRICLSNGTTYTVFVTAFADNGNTISLTSNWVSFTPAAATATASSQPE